MVLILYVQFNTAQLEMTTLKILENEGLKMNFSHDHNATGRIHNLIWDTVSK